MGRFSHLSLSSVSAVILALTLATSCQSTGSAVSTTSNATSSSTSTAATTNSGTTALVISPASETVSPGSLVQLSASGGTAPYTYSVISSNGSSGGGSINIDNGLYTAPDGAATVEIAVEDSAGSIADASLVVSTSNLKLVAPMASPVPSPTVAVNSTIEFEATGGAAPYTFAVASGTGTITADSSDSSGAIFSSTSSNDVSEISVTDSIGATTYTLITVGTGNSGNYP